MIFWEIWRNLKVKLMISWKTMKLSTLNNLFQKMIMTTAFTLSWFYTNNLKK